MVRRGVLGIFLIVAACGPSDKSVEEPGGGGDMMEEPPPPPPPQDLEDVFVYAHSSSDLYRVDPDTLDVTHVAAFVWPASIGWDQMTDIAIDRDGGMVGISYDRVYAVDKDTAVTTYLADLDREFNGLSFVPGETEELVAAALDGSLYRVDPMTGVATPIGSYGGNLGSSGDVVSVAGFGTVATVTDRASFGGADSLARVDPVTGAATPIGETGTSGLWGLGFWGDKVYGFSSSQQFFLLDVTTGAATLVESSGVSWWGAGVTTSAPVID